MGSLSRTCLAARELKTHFLRPKNSIFSKYYTSALHYMRYAGRGIDHHGVVRTASNVDPLARGSEQHRYRPSPMLLSRWRMGQGPAPVRHTCLHYSLLSYRMDMLLEQTMYRYGSQCRLIGLATGNLHPGNLYEPSME